MYYSQMMHSYPHTKIKRTSIMSKDIGLIIPIRTSEGPASATEAAVSVEET